MGQQSNLLERCRKAKRGWVDFSLFWLYRSCEEEGMAWKVEEDAAWMAEGDGSFRHYSGARLLRKGSRWNAIGAKGAAYPSRGSASSALEMTGRYDDLFDWGRAYGTVSHPTGAIGNDGVLFAFLSRDGAPFTPLVVSSLKRRFHGHARCVKCKEPMSEFRVAPIRQFDGATANTQTYVVCSCGFPVWHMETDVYFSAQKSMDQCAKAWKRKQDMKAAGGKHTRHEIGAIFELQEGRCIYCHALFTDELRPTRDHLVPLSYGGTAWALNLVLACILATPGVVKFPSAPSAVYSALGKTNVFFNICTGAFGLSTSRTQTAVTRTLKSLYGCTLPRIFGTSRFWA